LDLTVALDAMGGDHGPSVIVPAAFRVLEGQPELHLVLVGDRSILEREIVGHSSVHADRISVVHASQQVRMDELPSQALRTKKDSSMRVAIDLVKRGDAHACVSAGNTGALMATARFVLKTLPGIDRPAIIAALPSVTGHTHVLDLGANVESTPQQLFQFAVMGSVLVNAVDNISRPTVGLLNIGQEEMKGNESVKEAAQLLAASDIHYVGFVEGDDIYRGTANVVVCDGFVGNVLLKFYESVASFIVGLLANALGDAQTSHDLEEVFRLLDYTETGGAPLLGVNGIPIICHGGSPPKAIENAIYVADRAAKASMVSHFVKELTPPIESGSTV